MSIAKGHSVAYVRHGQDWFCFDDQNVHNSDIKEALSRSVGIKLFNKFSVPVLGRVLVKC